MGGKFLTPSDFGLDRVSKNCCHMQSKPEGFFYFFNSVTMDKSFTKENHVQMVGPDKVTNHLNCIRVCPDNSNSRNSLSLVVRCGRATIKKELGEAGWHGEERFEIVKLIVRCVMLLCCCLLHSALSFLFLLLFAALRKKLP